MAETTVTELSPVPKQWPGAFGLFKYSKAAIGFNVWTIVSLIVVVIAVNILLGIIFPGQQTAQIVGGVVVTGQQESPIASTLSNLFGAAVSIAIYATVLAGIRREKVSFSE